MTFEVVCCQFQDQPEQDTGGHGGDEYEVGSLPKTFSPRSPNWIIPFLSIFFSDMLIAINIDLILFWKDHMGLD